MCNMTVTWGKYGDFRFPEDFLFVLRWSLTHQLACWTVMTTRNTHWVCGLWVLILWIPRSLRIHKTSGIDWSVQWAQSLGIPLPSLKFHCVFTYKYQTRNLICRREIRREQTSLTYGMPGLWPEQSKIFWGLNIFSVSCYWQRQMADVAGDMLGFSKVKATYFQVPYLKIFRAVSISCSHHWHAQSSLCSDTRLQRSQCKTECHCQKQEDSLHIWHWSNFWVLWVLKTFNKTCCDSTLKSKASTILKVWGLL